MFVSVNPKTFQTQLSFTNETIKNKVYLLLTSTSSIVTIKDNSLFLPWFQFKDEIANINYLKKREIFEIKLDDFALSLIQEFLDDKKHINTKILNFENTNIEKELIEAGFKRELTDEQKRDLKKLLYMKHGANFSVPGAGKTTTLLALNTLYSKKKITDKLFVVSPINAFISWEEEIAQIFGKYNKKIYRMKSDDIDSLNHEHFSRYDVILVNYEKLRKDVDNLFHFFLKNNIHFVLDESHRIKSGKNNLSYIQIIKLADLAKRRDILSGTPMPQSYKDIEPQFYYLWRNNIFSYINENDSENLSRINSIIDNKFVRTTKNELGLKKPQIEYKNINMGPLQSELYDLLRYEIARIQSGMDQQSKRYFRSMGKNVVRLLQVASNPMLLSAMDDNYFNELSEDIPNTSEIWELLYEFGKFEKPSKIEYLKKYVSEILSNDKDKKIVIWSYFVRNIKLFEKIFEGFNPTSIYGGIPTGNDSDEEFREGRIKKFHNDKSCRILIGNPQACGEGISLHKASNHAIYFDRNFNAAHYLQSFDRIHRLGLDKNIETKVDILISSNTIDEILIDRLNQKTLAMGKVLDDPNLKELAYDPYDLPEDSSSYLDMEDIYAIHSHIKK